MYEKCGYLKDSAAPVKDNITAVRHYKGTVGNTGRGFQRHSRSGTNLGKRYNIAN
jgi:hypothetical protein